MEASDLVDRRGDDTDRRMVRVWLTPRGKALRAVIPRMLAQIRAEVFADLSVRDQALLSQLLSRVRVRQPPAD
jgi:DNA-binding MarR family transcriptional regulator